MEIIGQGRIRALNMAVLFVSVCLIVWIGFVWLKTFSGIEGQPLPEKKNPISMKEEIKKTAVPTYEIIIEKDLFKKTRRKFIPKPAPPVKVAATPPPVPTPRKPPPKLILLGTVLLENGNAAIIEYGGKSAYYRVGESIEEFAIKEIESNHVLLERDGEPLKVGITK